MSEHWIRLRGGWIADRGHHTDPPAWLTLPLPQPPWPGAPQALRRHFQAPPLDAERESLWLVVAQTSGLRAVRLNGDLVLAPAPGADSHEIALPLPLPRRSLLELELSEEAPGPSPVAWGHVALVIRSRDTHASPPGEAGD